MTETASMADDTDELSSFNGLYFKVANIIDLDCSEQRLADLTSRHVSERYLHHKMLIMYQIS